MSTKAPTADRFGFGPLIATQPLLHPVNSNHSKSRWETYLTAAVTCSRRAEGSEVKPSKGQLSTSLWQMIPVEIRLISYFLKAGKNIYGGKAKFTTNKKTSQRATEIQTSNQKLWFIRSHMPVTVIIVPLITGTANPLFLFIFLILNTFLIT